MFRRINSFQLFHQLHKTSFYSPKVNPLIVRNAATDGRVPESGHENWTEIYRLPLIRLASAFNRLKVYQGLATAVGTPMVFALEQSGHLGPNIGAVFGILGVTGIITLTLCSFPVRNLIGFVYINDREDKIKLAYVNFWGRRQDQELVIDDIFAPWELPDRRINIYQPVKSRTDASQSYKLLNRYGVIRDPQRYVAIFGADSK